MKHKRDLGILATNTIFLYVLTFSSQLIILLLIPYETRVLGSSAYGVLSLAVSMSMIMTIVLDFGFILTATELVVKNRSDKQYLAELVSNVLVCKAALACISAVVMAVLIGSVEPFSSNKGLFILYFIAYVLNAFLPDFIYRGMEQMRAIALRTLVVRLLFSLPIFFFLRSSGDIWVIPLFLLIGNFLACVYSYFDIYKTYSIGLCMPRWSEVGGLLRRSLPFFISRFASTFYQSLNSVLLGLFYPGHPIVGQYGAAEKFLSVTRTISSPVSDSLYPYMVRTKQYRLCKRILLVACPLIVITAVIVFINAEAICELAFGSEYVRAAVLLRCLLPAICCIFPTYILCFPMLVPMGLSNYANRSNVVGAIVQIASLMVLFVTGYFSAVTLCLAASLSEVAVFIYRAYAVIRNRGLMC